MFKTKKIKIFFFFTVFAILLFSFSSAEAQVRESDISVVITPDTPSPLEQVTITLSSFSTDLNKALISWSLDSKFVIEEIGKKVFSFTTGEGGSPSTIDVNINILGSGTLSKRIIVQPGGVDLLWQTVDSYVPRFYRGKALPAPEARIKVVAVPDIKSPGGVKLKSSDFSYSWKHGFNPVQSASGFSKSSFTFKNSYLDTVDNIGVTLSSIDGLSGAKNNIVITPSQPKIVFYQRDLQTGKKSGQALSNPFHVPVNKMVLEAEPFFFSESKLSENLKYVWRINGEPVSSGDPKNTLPLQVEGGKRGQVNVDLKINDVSKLFQSMEGTLSLIFD